MTRDALLLLAIAAGALTVRAWLPLDRIVGDGFVDFQGDAWYHMRAVDHLIHNYPRRLTHDPYAVGGGQYVGVAPLFDIVVTTVALIVGLGDPSPRTVEVVGAVIPAVLGTIAVVLTGLLARRVFDRPTALIAAALLAVMPGHFLDRTLLGVTDHHAAETTLVLLILYLTVAGLQASRSSMGAGVALGAYFLTWTSAPFFAFALAVWLVLQFTIGEARSASTRWLTTSVLLMAITALVLVIAFQNAGMIRYQLQIAALAGLAVLSATLRGAASLEARGALPRVAVVSTPLALAAVVIAGVYWWLPDLTRQALADLTRLTPNASARRVVEVQPLLLLAGQFSLLHPWNVFGSSFYLAVPALVALGVRVVKHRDAADSLIVVWATVTFVATLGQNRFGYYLAPMLAILAGWAASALLAWAGRHGSAAQRRNDVAAVAVAVVLFYPSLRPGLASIARQEGVPVSWRDALTWLREHTPEPFSDPGYYTARYQGVATRRPAYTVMNWWDYGYWITRIGRRVPVSNPTQANASEAARFYTASDEADAMTILESQHSRYVLVDSDLPLEPIGDRGVLHGKFNSMAEWAGLPPDRFAELMFRQEPAGLVPVWVFYPDYYRAIGVRLFLFGTTAVEPSGSTWVITYADRRDTTGVARRELVNATQFPSYPAAERHLRALGPGPFRIGSFDPSISPVPLVALKRFRLIHEARTPASHAVVRAFEVVAR